MSLTGALRTCYIFTTIASMIIYAVYVAFTNTWTNEAVVYMEYDAIGRRQFSFKKCYKIFWDRNAFRGFIENRTIEIVDSDGSTFREHSCNRFMQISPDGGGRMGNQLFRIAALFGTSFEYDIIPIVSASFPLLKYFDLPNVLSIDLRLKNAALCSPPFTGIFHRCLNIGGHPVNMTLQGYVQSWKYFANSADIIRTILKIRNKYLEQAKLFLEAHQIDGFKNICIHVRRGDMTTDLSLASHGFSVTGVEFIHKAVQFCESNFKKAIFFVISDDIKWCKRNIKRKVIFSSFDDPGYDLALMSLCDHVIVTSGSFGWWGAWLSNGTAVYFNGYPRPGSQLDTTFKREDYYPPQWIGLS